MFIRQESNTDKNLPKRDWHCSVEELPRLSASGGDSISIDITPTEYQRMLKYIVLGMQLKDLVREVAR